MMECGGIERVIGRKEHKCEWCFEMMKLRLDNCCHCACVTPLAGFTIEGAIRDLENRELGCWNCSDVDSEHTNCVQLLDGEGVVLWDGTRPCELRRGRKS